ncbi:MAG TPA: carboxypeptidase M32, partial [Gemmataceae bacterium]|nr:carboxypeptidase M32 [Gemmataceae bacterium]
MTAEDAYAGLVQWSQQAATLASCAEMLGWDEETYMPRGGVAHRARQMALLAGLHHERLTDPRLGDLIEAVESSSLVKDPLSDQAVNARLLRRTYDRACQLPRGLVEEMAQVTALAQQEWAIALRRSDFARFLPWLKRIVNLKQREAESHSGSPASYDALLEDYEPGLRTDHLTKIFTELRQQLNPLLESILGGKRQPDVTI